MPFCKKLTNFLLFMYSSPHHSPLLIKPIILLLHLIILALALLAIVGTIRLGISFYEVVGED